jgi:hypothetical protein
MCGEVLNFEAFEATIGSSESVANALNLIGVTQLLKPQSQQGLAAFPLARNVLANNVVIQSDYAACIQTDLVGTTTSVSSLQDEIQTRQQQKSFYLQTLQKSVAPFYPFLEITDSYLNKSSCVV